MNIIKDETGVYAELSKDGIKFESKEAEIMYDLTLENDMLQQELQRKDNIIKEVKKYINSKTQHYVDEIYFKETNELLLNEEELDELNDILDNIKELENEKK